MRPQILAGICVVCALLTGCASPSPGDGSGEGAMGMGGSGDFDGGVTQGSVAATGTAALEVPEASGDGGHVTVRRVLSPSDGWVVVRSIFSPGAVLGRTWVPKGESRDVRVRLTAADAPQATVALNVDRGRRRDFEFDPSLPISGIDKPLYVERVPLSAPVKISTFGTETLPNAALVLASDQAAKRSFHVDYALTPAPTWIVVREFSGGLPGRVLGATWRPAGELQEIEVPVDVTPSTDEIIVALHADTGTPEKLDFSTENPLTSPDQPWVSAGVMVAQRVRLLEP